MLQKKPYFTFRIESKNARYEAKFNGVPITLNTKGSNLTTEEPVNQYVTQGKNEITINAYPFKGDDFGGAQVTVSLYVNQDSAPETDKKLLGQVHFSEDAYKNNTLSQLSMRKITLDSKTFEETEKGDIRVLEATVKPTKALGNGVKVSQEVIFNSSIPTWKFIKDAEEINFPDTFSEYKENKEHYIKELIEPLYEEYKKIFQLISKEDYSQLREEFKQRNSEFDKALYLSDGDYESRLISELKGDAKSKIVELYPIENAYPMVTDDKKLIKLGRESILLFSDKENAVYSYYPVWFYKKDGKWHIAR